MRALIISAALLGQVDAQAGCNPPNDSWTSSDKAGHVMIGALPAVIAGTQLKDPVAGFWWGAGVAVGFELFQAASGSGVCSWKDAVVGIVGAGFGAAGSHYFIRMQPQGGVMVGYSTRFR
jgi:uncharacterized protein YfiM (DUF2279 family)